MSVIQVPYHLDEHLPELDVPLPPDTVITADLPAGDVWGRLSALYSGLAAAVASEAGRGGRPVVLSGDCMAPGGPSPAQVTGALSALLGMGRVAAVGVACTWYPGHSAAERIRQHLGAALA